ncbi:kinase-like protein [Phlegmacium glaucopus]|nr:kinase-like protein [Phlegmacium glaucopus]
MEYCGGGDLSTTIKQATKQSRPLPEDTIGNYFLQILLALHHCHHSNAHVGNASGSSANVTGAMDADVNSRTQILHRDLKPDNDAPRFSGHEQLGDFGLLKALAQASFVNTYVGTPYYMPPELINGRIPLLPRGYSQALTSVIKPMFSAQLLQHERLEFIFNVAETEKMLSVVKGHRSTLANKEQQHMASLLSHKIGKLLLFTNLWANYDNHIRCQREEEVALVMAQHEEEIMEAVRNGEEQLSNAWAMREAKIRKEVVNRENDLVTEETRLNEAREELEEKIRKIDEGVIKVRKERSPLEEVKNRLGPMNRTTQETPIQHLRRKCASQPTPKLTRPAYIDFMPSAMKGVVLTSTGETLATPSQAELVNLFQIFDFEGGNLEGMPSRERQDDEEEANSPPPIPKEPIWFFWVVDDHHVASWRWRTSSYPNMSTFHLHLNTEPVLSPHQPLNPFSQRSSSVQPKLLPHPHLHRSKSISNLASNPAAVVRAATMPVGPISQVHHHHTAPEYDLNDEENLPSPFLKKNEKSPSHAKAVGAIGPMMNRVYINLYRRPSSGLLLRTVAAASNVGRRGTTSSTSTIVSPVLDNGDPQIEYAPSVNAGVTRDNRDGGRIPRPSARKVSEEARKALLRA